MQRRGAIHTLEAPGTKAGEGKGEKETGSGQKTVVHSTHLHDRLAQVLA